MTINVETISPAQADKILAFPEGHFGDLKAIEVAPAKLTEFVSAFANSDGGELYIGIDELKPDGKRVWRGFSDQEAANGHIQIFEKLFPLGQDFQYTFLATQGQPGLVLQVLVRKTAAIKTASDGHIYIRRGAQKLRLVTDDEKKRLEYAKGLHSFENELTSASLDSVTNSTEVISFMLEIVPTAEPEVWLRKQTLIRDAKVTVAGVLLFADEPQAIIPKHCGIKIYRYRTTDKAGSRETLAFTPLTIEGSAFQQILKAVQSTITTIEEAPALGDAGLEKIRYPREAIHEIVTNAVIHRDYSVADDIHIRIFDNRIEVESPGQLPGHVTPENILDERFARNGNVVRLLNKYPDPPNKDVGEGLNTAFSAMRKLGLKDPVILNKQNSVLVIIRHERLASYEQQILEYLESHDSIKNKQARELCFVDADYRMKRILGRLEDRKLIEKVPGTSIGTTAYQKGPKFADWRSQIDAAEPADDPADDGSDENAAESSVRP